MIRTELSRKALHLLSAVVPVAYAMGAPWRLVVFATALGAMLALSVELARSAHDGTARRFRSVVGVLLRPHELERWTGATWLALALLLAVAAYPRDVAIAAMWSVSVGDAAAALAGRTIGRHERAGGATGKTITGSVACLSVAFAGAMMLARMSLAESLAVGLLAAIAERPARPLDDNLRIVLVVGIGILLWRITLY